MNVTLIGLLLIITLSAAGSVLLIAKKSVEKPVKVMMFVGYFWLLAFVQFTVFSLANFLWRHFFYHIQ